MTVEHPVWSVREELLRLSVQAAVPLLIAELRQKGGPNDVDWDSARAFATELGERGDILQFTGEKPGETATVFNRLAYAMAVVAFAPGGVDFAGLHFEGI